jgi:hypothetical protein
MDRRVRATQTPQQTPLTQRRPLRADALVDFIARTSRFRLVLTFTAIYVAAIVLLSLIVWVLQRAGATIVLRSPPGPVTFPDLVYFDFTTALTVTYGDFVPVGLGRILVIGEAFVSMGWYSVFASVVVIKLLLLPDDSIKFGKYAYYRIDDASFMVVFVNTVPSQMVNAQFSSYFRIGRRVSMHPGQILPYVGNSVWRLEVDGLPREELKGLLIDPEQDLVRFGISASYRFATYTSAVGYGLNDILVLASRGDTTAADEHREGMLMSSCTAAPGLDETPDSAETFVSYAQRMGAIVQGSRT